MTEYVFVSLLSSVVAILGTLGAQALKSKTQMKLQQNELNQDDEENQINFFKNQFEAEKKENLRLRQKEEEFRDLKYQMEIKIYKLTHDLDDMKKEIKSLKEENFRLQTKISECYDTTH